MRDEEKIDAFVGNRAAYYRERWRSFSESPGSMTSFNPAACVGQVLWLAYRKLYLASFWFMAAIVADVSLVLYVEEHQLAPAGVVTAWNTIVAVLSLAVPGLYGNYWASLYQDAGHLFDATGPLTIAEVEGNFLSRMDLELTVEQRACVLREIEDRARSAGDPETLDPATFELIPEEAWGTAGPSGTRIVLAQVITTKALLVCQSPAHDQLRTGRDPARRT